MDPSPEDMALEIDDIRADVAPLLESRSHLAAAMALTLTAAHHVIHDGGDEGDFMAVARAAWARSAAIHAEGRCG